MQGERAPVRVRVPAGCPEERAGAGHHHRHGALLLQHPAAPLHHPRRPGPRGVPQEHDHRRLARAGGAARHRRARGRARELQAPRLHPLDARHPPDQRAGQQDGPAGLGPGQVRGHRHRVRRLPRPAGRAPHELHPDQRARRRQHRLARGGGPLVRRAHGAGPGRGLQAARRRPRPAVPHAAAGRLQVHRGLGRPAHLRRHHRDRPHPPRRRRGLPAVAQALDGHDDRGARRPAPGRGLRRPGHGPHARARRCTPSRAS